MHSLFSMRPYRILTTLIPLTILMGCGEGDGPARIQNEPADPFAGPPASCFEALTFEDICDQVITYAEFEGAPGRTVDNPDPSGINTSAKVAEFVKNRSASGATFGGTVVDFSAVGALTIPAGSSVTAKVWSQRQVNVLFEPEGGGQGSGDEVTHGGTGWEELTFNLNFSGTTSGWVFIFDNGTNGDGGTDPLNWTFYADDISVPMAGGGGGGGGTASFPITFDEATAPAVTEFGGAGFAIEPGPAGGDGNALKIVRDGGDNFAGAWVAVPEIPNDQGDQTISALVYSPTADIPMVAKAEFGDNMGSGEVPANETVVVGWQTLTWTFTNLTAPNVYNRFTLLPNLGTVDTATDYFFDNIDLVAGGGGGGGGGALGPIDFESGGQGAGFTWNVFENGDNPPVEFIANPDASGANTSATVAQFTARQAGQPFAGTITADLPTFTLDASNSTVTILVWKSVISDVGIKFENATGGSSGEIKVANTVTDQWEELTFDFSGVIGDPNNTDITGLVIFPDFDARTQDNVVYFDNITFSDGSGGGTGGGGGGSAAVDFETADTGAAFTWNVFENGDNPPLEIIANPDASGANTSATVAQFTARQAGQPFAGTITNDLPTFTLDASNSTVTILVWKSVISDVGIKFENATGGSTGEIKVANTVTDQWEELTFDFSGVIGDPNNTDITGLVIFPDFDARTQDNVIYFDTITFSDGGGGTGGGGGATSFDFESGSATFIDFDGGVATVIANPDASGINTSAQVGQMQKFAGQPFGGSTLDLGGAVPLAAGDSYTMKVRSSRSVVVTLKLEPLNEERTATHSGSGTWEELCFDFTGVSGDVTGITLIFDNGTVGDAANDPDNWTFQFDDIAQTSNACPTAGPSLGPIDFEPNGQGEAFAWTVFENADNPPLEIIDNPDASGANTSGRVAQFTARVGGQPFAGTITSDLPTFTLDATNAIVKIKVWKSVISDVGIKFENGAGGSTGEIKVANTVTDQWEELTFDFSGVIGDPNNTDIAGLVIFPDFDARTQDNIVYFDDVTFEAVSTGGGGGSAAVDFETAGTGTGFTWNIFENGDNPPLEFIANPDATGANTSATVAQFTARVAGQPFAGTITNDLPTFTLDASNAIVKIKVWKPVISDVGIKFETATGGSTGEIKVANTVTNQWEELTFDFSGVIGDPNNTDITGLVIFPDFDARTQDNVVYFDDVTFEAVPTGGGGTGSFVNGDFETGDFTGWTLTQDPPGRGSINVDSSGQGGRAGTVARLVAAGDATGTNDVVIGQVALGAGTIQPGDSIDVSFDLYGSLTGAGGVVFVEVIFLNAAGQDEGGRNFVGPAAPYTPTTTWTTYSGTVIAGVGANAGGWDVSGGVTLELKAACGAIAGGCGVDASFDNVTFTIN